MRSSVRTGFLVVLLLCLAFGAVQGQRPSLVIASVARDSIQQVLREELEKEGLTFASQSKDRTLYKLALGQMPVRQRMTPVTLEVTFHLENGNPGTKIVVSEELVASLNNAVQERRYPNPNDRRLTWLEILGRVKSRIETRGEPADTTHQ